jgi:hypothetical protein
MQREGEPLISIAAAAEKLGLNRSTLTRQVAKGSIRCHDGKVLLSEVIEDRAKNLSVRRGGKKRDGDALRVEAVAQADVATRSVAPTVMTFPNEILPDPSPEQAAVVDAFATFFKEAILIIASAAVATKVPMIQAYAVTEIAQFGLLNLADGYCKHLGVPGWAAESHFFMVDYRSAAAPDWASLAAAAGESFDLEAWEAFTSALPFFCEPEGCDAESN